MQPKIVSLMMQFCIHFRQHFIKKRVRFFPHMARHHALVSRRKKLLHQRFRERGDLVQIVFFLIPDTP